MSTPFTTCLIVGMAAVTSASPAIGAQPSAVGRETAFSNLDVNLTSPGKPTSIYLVQDGSTWRDVWTDLNRGKDPPPSVPSVDFKTQSIIGIFLGSRPSGGYSVHLQRIMEYPDKVTLEVVETTPGDGCVVTTLITNPNVFVTINRVNWQKPVDFKLTVKREPCN